MTFAFQLFIINYLIFFNIEVVHVVDRFVEEVLIAVNY